LAKRISMLPVNHLVQHDPLTGLFNRTVLTRQLETALGEGRNVVLLLIDRDDFRTINDCCGHDEGDKILQFVARKLATAAKTTDVVARLDGDEFAILLVDPPRERAIIRLFDDIIAALRGADADALAGVGARIGISRSGNEARTGPEILRNAELALDQANTEGWPTAF
jgi:diguanylate cyclase (GGDEF)-like protein